MQKNENAPKFRVDESNGRTDGRTDRQTDERTPARYIALEAANVNKSTMLLKQTVITQVIAS